MTKNPRIVRWHMGASTTKFPFSVRLMTKDALQIRDLALESARMTANRVAEKALGRQAYHLHLRLYPHHILRENALASGAGADRLSTGMKMSFGKTIGIAARLKVGQEVMRIDLAKENIAVGKEALQRAKSKLPSGYQIVIIDNAKAALLEAEHVKNSASPKKPASSKKAAKVEKPVAEVKEEAKVVEAPKAKEPVAQEA